MELEKQLIKVSLLKNTRLVATVCIFVGLHLLKKLLTDRRAVCHTFQIKNAELGLSMLILKFLNDLR
jgi:hypothetical protein